VGFDKPERVAGLEKTENASETDTDAFPNEFNLAPMGKMY